ncbi:MAG TPA: ABC transporter ATP-binding protein [Flexilinea sp.]|nr:ABC transporter ATP-binding protein [Flexilinea sp.]
MIAIQTVGLTKKYGKITAVDNLNISVNKGELFALLGLNGAGKTTTIKMLSCLTRPTGGDAILLGDSIISKPLSIKQKTNISPQETAIAPNLTIRENLELIAGIYGQDKKTAHQNAICMANRFELDNLMTKKVKALSGGLQRRLSIAMALISEPQILFLDEPTLGLDVLARRELWSAIKSLKGKVTIILTTHYMEEVEELSDRIGILSSGKLLATGTISELMAQTNTNKFEDAFVILAKGGR